ncbi:MAG TPA: phosphoribosylformylglycinamidine synthase subunit PurL [Dehalococcoidia bacterium]|nr:phosphoribosylformylglycinamidine synthase subunit PurL [Dehalococcoidia bacterium]
MPRDPETLALIALSVDEYDQIVSLLDREPNDVELGMFGAMWSEHCGYKNSKPLLRLFPSTGPHVLTTRGGENAGAVDIGGGYCVVFKIESHNHPSAVEPYEGAATGVGGIVRDIFAMGARPIALLDSLRFGPLAPRQKNAMRPANGRVISPAQASRNRSLFKGVVAGIGGYGNCLGVPTVGGEVSFAGAYNGNPLVNAMCVGLARSDKLLRAVATGAGNPIILVGADTGRDGIGGANVLASRTFEAGQEELRPTVQVGNPFLEKLLMEACVQLAEEHADWIVGLQDCGAAGLTSSLVECAARGNAGIEIDVSLVPRRESGMTAAEVMLSESQERMLVIAKKEHEQDVLRLFQHWEIHADVIGKVTDDGLVRIYDGDQPAVRVPATVFTEPPEYRRQGTRPKGLDELQTYDLAFLPDIVAWEDPDDANAALLQLLASPEIASKRWIWRQYDHQVLTNTVVGPGSDAAVLRVKDAAPRALAVSTDGNGVKTYLDPFAGGALAVAEACRNVACSGARPVAITDCLNFGNPERLDVYFQLEEAVRGMAAACETLGVPVISGNVSLYNESDGEAIYPTPVVGALGVLDDVSKTIACGFQNEGDVVYLIGARAERQGDSDLIVGDPIELAGSEYLRQVHDLVAGSPRIDLALEARVQRVLVEAADERLLHSAHDCSHGGLAVTLAEACIRRGIGFATEGIELGGRLDAALFGETPSRVVVSVAPERVADLEALCQRIEVPFVRLGRTGGDRLRISINLDLPLAEIEAAYEGALEAALKGQP